MRCLPVLILTSFLQQVSVVKADSFFWNVSSGLWPTQANWVDGVGAAVNPTTFTANNGTGDYNLANGASGSLATTTMTGIPTPRYINSLTIGEFNTLSLTGTADTQNAGTPRILGLLTNAGLIQAGTASTDFLRMELNSSGSNINTGEIKASQGTFRLQINTSGTLDNTGGLMRVLNGATLNISSGASAGGIQNGILRSEVGGLLQVGVYDVQSALRLNGVTVENLGTFTTVQNTTISTTSARTVNTFLNGASALTNAVDATVNVLNTGSGANAGTVSRLDVRFDINNTASFDNQGLLNITNNTTRTGGSLIGNSAVFSVTSATATFQNTGTIQVVNDSTSTGATAVFTSVKSIINAGTVRVKGDAGNANASFIVTGTGNDYTQSGTGLRTLLERGGALIAADAVSIQSGDLGGVGTITGLTTTIGSAGRLVAGDTLSAGVGAGVLTINSNLTFNDNSTAVFALGADTAASGQVALGSGFNLTIGTAVKISLLDLDGSATSGTYRLFNLNGGSISGTFVLDTLPAGWNGSLTTGSNYVDFTFTAAPVPEPAAYALILGVVALAAVTQRRRRA